MSWALPSLSGRMWEDGNVFPCTFQASHKRARSLLRREGLGHRLSACGLRKHPGAVVLLLFQNLICELQPEPS